MSSSDPAARRIGPIGVVGVIGRPQSPNADDAVRDALAYLDERDIRTVVEIETAARGGLASYDTCERDDLPSKVDLLLVLGGDGTLLSIAHPVSHHVANTPVLAVNCGSLGFLTEITRPEMRDALESVLAGTADLDERRMLRARVIRSGSEVADRIILNDVVIGKSAHSNIIDVSISVGDHFVTRSRGDGVIVATPTGSTAYNLAAGGPIVHPTIDAVVITPIAPHTLTNRPVVLGDPAPITITPNLAGDHLDASASFDGQVSIALENGDVVTVERAPHPLRVVRAQSRHYFAVLREKLKWGER